MGKLSKLGRYFFAIAVLASGIQQLIIADFVRLVPKLPAWLPVHPVWAGVVGAALIGIGLAIALGKGVRPAALLLGAMLLLTFLGQRVPEIVANPGVGFVWTNPCKVLALLGGTLLVAFMPPGHDQPAGRYRFTAMFFLGLFLLVCGVQHFVYADFVQSLVPAWIPPGRLFWTYLTGVALIAGGAGVCFLRTVRWAAGLSGLMIFLWVGLLHVPRAMANLQEAGETSAIFEALALSGVALLVAAPPPRKTVETGVGPVTRILLGTSG